MRENGDWNRFFSLSDGAAAVAAEELSAACALLFSVMELSKIAEFVKKIFRYERSTCRVL